MDLGSGAPRSSCEQPMCRKTPRLKGNAWTSFKLRLNTVGSIKGIIWIPCCLQQGSDVWQGRYIAKLQSNSAGQLWNAGNTEWKTEADWNSYWQEEQGEGDVGLHSLGKDVGLVLGKGCVEKTGEGSLKRDDGKEKATSLAVIPYKQEENLQISQLCA